jgi:hypothetical protein
MATEVCEACGRPLGPTARDDDPSTSHDAGRAVAERESKVLDVRPGTQRAKLLAAYGRNSFTTLSDEQAASLADLHYQGICWWKRCSELRQGGFIRVVGHGEGSNGAAVQRCVLTGKGLAKLRELAS